MWSSKHDISTIETMVTVDPGHTVKNTSLQPMHLSRLPTLGRYVMLTLMLVRVRIAANLHAADVNGSDPMCVSAAEWRINVATRRELAKHPDCFALLVYYWAAANARAAWWDRDPKTTPRMRVRWACNSLVFMRWWLDWIEVSGKGSATHFISMETHAANVLMDQMLISLVLLWGEKFRDLPFAPWLVGSDQNEHFNNELRSFRLNQPDWTFADVLRLTARFIYQLTLMTRPDVHLPALFSPKGFNRSAYTPSVAGEHVHSDWPTRAEVRAEYECVRPLFTAAGAAEELRAAGRWHRPSLEEWASIEKACDAQEAELCVEAGRRPAEGESEEGEGEEGTGEGGEGGGGVEAEAGDGDDAEETVFFPDDILNDKLLPGQRAEARQFLIKWQGWSAAALDVTWETQAALIEDGHALLVLAYLQEQHRKGRKLVIPEGLQEAAKAQAEEEGEALPEAAPPPQPQPPIEPPDRAALLLMLAAPVGAEQPNGMTVRALKPGASDAQRHAYEASHVTNLETGQTVHKQAAPVSEWVSEWVGR